MNRIDARFRELRASGQKGFIAYICAGDPNLSVTAKLALALEAAGVDVLEFGVPFSDPLADGVVNQLAAERALRAGTTLSGVLRMIAGLRRRGCEMPVVLYIYFNLIHKHGMERFCRDAAAAGVDGVLALDLPPEESAAYETHMKRAGVHPIFLVAPTTPPTRIREICRHASGFVYCISREGVTGMRNSVPASVAGMVRKVRRHSKLPVAVGFGISTPAQARAVSKSADAVVVGSAIVNQISKRQAVKAVGDFVGTLVEAVRR